MTWVYRRPFDYRPQNRLGHDFRAILYAAGALAGTASLTFSESAALTGTGELAASEALTLGASGIPGSGNPNAIEGAGALTFGQNATLSGSGALVGVGAIDLGASSAPSGSNAYQPSQWSKKRRNIDPPPFDYYQWAANRWTIFPYTVSTQTAGIGSVAIGANAVARGTGRLASAANPRFTVTGTITGAGALVGTAGNVFGVGTAALLNGASGSITAQQGFTFGGSGTLRGVGNLYGPADLDFTASATTQTLVPPSGSGELILGATGTLRNAAEGAGIVTSMSFASTDGLQMFFSA